MIFWIIAVLMMLAVAAVLLVPALRRGAEDTDAAEFDLEVYRHQLQQLDADKTAGLIGGAEADAAQTEISRRMLDADARRGATPAGQRPMPASRWIAAATAAVVPLGAILLYADWGAPGVPGHPFAERGQQVSEQTTKLRARIAKLRENLEQNPENLEGWVLLATSLGALRDYDRASKAYEMALGLDAGNAGLVAAYGETLVLANNGVVTPAARAAFESALKKSAGEPRARFYLAIAEEQAGNNRAALDRWLALLKDSPPTAPWAKVARQRAINAAQAAGIEPDSVIPPPAAAQKPPGPSSGDVAAAQSMSPEDRAAMIEGMVAKLADRLKEEPDDLEGWMRLGRAYTVLNRHGDAKNAMSNAARLAPKNVDILTLYARTLRTAAENKQTPESVAVMRKVLALDAKNIEGLWLVGRAEIANGKIEEGRAKMQQAIDSLPAGSPDRAKLQQHLDDLSKTKN
jgi:cytochrome c-type biogenesis protein CcmH